MVFVPNGKPAFSFYFFCAFILFALPASAQTPGSIDTSFAPETGSTDVLWSMSLQSDGKILTSGRRRVDSLTIKGLILRLNTNGTVDNTFSGGPRGSIPDTGSAIVSQIYTIATRTNGMLVLGGDFTLFDDVASPRLAQVDSSGTFDATFSVSANNAVFSTLVQPDGKILVTGTFTNFLGSGQNCVARLNADTSLDNTFTSQFPQASTQKAGRALALQSDGKIIVGGDFTNSAQPYLVRLATSGAVDNSFTPSINGNVHAVAVQTDGKILIGGEFTSVNGTNRSRIARLNTDGSLDLSFDPGNGCDDNAYAIAVLGSGKILVGGKFNNVNGQPRRKIVRLETGGGLDSSFDSNAGSGTLTADEVRAIRVQSDGKILVSGKFTTFSGVPLNGIARLNAEAVTAPPVILQHPESQTVSSGSSANFTVQASGAGSLSYQWYFNSGLISSATASQYSISNAQLEDAGSYFVVVSNEGGSQSSSNATLSVNLIAPVITAVSDTPSGINIGMFFSPGRTNRLQYATNLISSQWTDLVVSPPFVGTSFTDTNKTGPQRFYRIRSP